MKYNYRIGKRKTFWQYATRIIWVALALFIAILTWDLFWNNAELFIEIMYWVSEQIS